MGLDRISRRAAEKFRERLEQRFGSEILEVRAFGSRCRGDARKDSDLDVFVMVQTEEPALQREIAGLAWDVAYEELGMERHISPLVMSRQHFQKLLALELRLAQDILSEGIAL